MHPVKGIFLFIFKNINIKTLAIQTDCLEINPSIKKSNIIEQPQLFETNNLKTPTTFKVY